MSRDKREILDLVAGSLMGGTIGDALGLPFETMPAEEIWIGVPGGAVSGFITDPTGCSDEIQCRLKRRPPGMISDDTQLSFAVADSLIRSRGFDPVDQAASLVASYHHNTDNVFGWGGTTLAAAVELAEWFSSGGTRGRNPRTPVAPSTKPGKGCGNGVAMRAGPLALYHALTHPESQADFFPNFRSLGLMTHGDQRAWIAAACAGVVISTPLLEGRPSAIDVVDLSEDGGCDGCDSMYAVGLERLAHCICCNSERLEQMFADGTPDRRSLAWAFREALAATDSAAKLMDRVGTSSFALESVPFAVGTFFRHPTDFRAALLEAVNAGGDTDTTAAMVGTMVGANVGESGIPAEWIEKVPAASRARELAVQMVDLFFQP